MYSTECSEAEKLRFLRACEAAEPKRVSAGGTCFSGIGTVNEKSLHAIIKLFLAENTALHEIRVIDAPAMKNAPDTVTTAGAKYVADILDGDAHGGDIYEVQTGSFYPLQSKLRWYMDNTPYYITLVYPIARERRISWIEPTDGSVGKPRLSPKRGQITDVARELYWIKDFIGNRRFSLRVLLIDTVEYRLRNGWDKTGKRGSERSETAPYGLAGVAYLNDASDYCVFLPETLPAIFTAKDYAKATGIRGKATYSVLKVLCGLGLTVVADEKQGRSVAYRKS